MPSCPSYRQTRVGPASASSSATTPQCFRNAADATWRTHEGAPEQHHIQRKPNLLCAKWRQRRERLKRRQRECVHTQQHTGQAGIAPVRQPQQARNQWVFRCKHCGPQRDRSSFVPIVSWHDKHANSTLWRFYIDPITLVSAVCSSTASNTISQQPSRARTLRSCR